LVLIFVFGFILGSISVFVFGFILGSISVFVFGLIVGSILVFVFGLMEKKTETSTVHRSLSHRKSSNNCNSQYTTISINFYISVNQCCFLDFGVRLDCCVDFVFGQGCTSCKTYRCVEASPAKESRHYGSVLRGNRRFPWRLPSGLAA